MTATWQDVPRGYYAVEILHQPCNCIDNDLDEQCEHMPELLGYRLFERKTPRITKTGRRIGKNQFISGATAMVPGVDRDLVRTIIAQEDQIHREMYGPHGDQQHIYDLLTSMPDYYRAEYGKFTGRCGCCGRTLTDPDSKLCGIGPECRKGARS